MTRAEMNVEILRDARTALEHMGNAIGRVFSHYSIYTGEQGTRQHGEREAFLEDAQFIDALRVFWHRGIEIREKIDIQVAQIQARSPYFPGDHTPLGKEGS